MPGRKCRIGVTHVRLPVFIHPPVTCSNQPMVKAGREFPYRPTWPFGIKSGTISTPVEFATSARAQDANNAQTFFPDSGIMVVKCWWESTCVIPRYVTIPSGFPCFRGPDHSIRFEKLWKTSAQNAERRADSRNGQDLEPEVLARSGLRGRHDRGGGPASSELSEPLLDVSNRSNLAGEPDFA